MEGKIFEISYSHIGTFLERDNRFLATVDIDGKFEKVHVHDPGRLKELLFKGNKVLVKRVNNLKRKTNWDLLAAYFDGLPVFTNSMYHSKIAKEILLNKNISPFKKVTHLQSEVKLSESRIDFLIKNHKKIWVEVKGCTLCENGIALFPDAPTKRGTKHINSLLNVKDRLNEVALLILIFRKDAEIFSPNEKTDPLFAKTFYEALKHGLKVYPYVLEYDGKWIKFVKKISVKEANK